MMPLVDRDAIQMLFTSGVTKQAPDAVGLEDLPGTHELRARRRPPRRSSIASLIDKSDAEAVREARHPGRDQEVLRNTGGASIRTNHLGVPIPPRGGKMRVKYCRSYTIVYHKRRDEHHDDLVKWDLFREVSRVCDLSTAGLERLLDSFISTAVIGSSVGPGQFKAVLAAHGVRDRVLVQRLFSAFRDEARLPETDCGSRDAAFV